MPCPRIDARGEHVIGIDNLNPYYDPALKQARLDDLARVACRAGSISCSSILPIITPWMLR